MATLQLSIDSEFEGFNEETIELAKLNVQQMLENIDSDVEISNFSESDESYDEISDDELPGAGPARSKFWKKLKNQFMAI